MEKVITCQKRINDFSQQKGQTQETNPLAGLIQTLPGSSPPWTLLQVKSRQNYRNWFSLNFVCLLVEGQGSRVTSRGSRVYGRGSRVNGRGSRVILSNLKPSLRSNADVFPAVTGHKNKSTKGKKRDRRFNTIKLLTVLRRTLK